MKMFLTGLLFVILLLALDANAQFKPSEQQYLEQTNLAFNSGFEQGLRNWTNANGVFSVDSTNFVLGKKSGKVALTAQALDFSQTLSTGYNTALSGLQGHVAAYAKADFPFQVCALIDGVESNCVNGSGDNKFDFYDIPIVLGSTSLGIKFKSLTSYTGSIYVDGVEYGHKQFVSNVAQSEYVGSLEWRDNDCLFERANTGYGTMISSTSNCSAIIDGNITYPITNQSAFTIPNAPVGRYKIDFQGFMYNQNNTNVCKFTLSRDGDYDDQGEVYVNEASGGNRVYNTLTGHFENSTTGDLTIRIVNKNTGGTTCRLFGNVNNSAKFAVYYYPPQSQIVRQATENFAKSLGTLTYAGTTNCVWANTKTASYNSFAVDSDCPTPTFSTGAVISFDGDKNPSFTLPKGSPAGQYKVTVNGAFENDFNTDNIACLFRVSDGTNHSTINHIYTSGQEQWDSSKTFILHLDNDLTVDTTYDIQSGNPSAGAGSCRIINLPYSGLNSLSITVDYIPTDQKMTITGSFEQIKSTELVKFVGNPSGTVNAASGVTTTVNLDEIEIDNNNAYDSVNNYYVIPKDSTYQVCVNAGTTGTGTGSFLVYALKNGTTKLTEGRQYLVGGRQAQPSSCKVLQLSQGDNVRLEVFQDMGATAGIYTGEAQTFMTIEETPDIASIVKNLNDNKNVKCQTKYLSANFNTSGGVISDLGFSGLTIGKRYRLKAHHRVVYNNNDTVTLRYDYPVSGTDILAVFSHGFNGQSPSTYSEIDFTASEISIQAKGESINAGNAIMGGQVGGQVDDTRATLCELPDNYIEGSF